MHVAGEAVEFGDHQRSATPAALIERGGELRAVRMVFAALDFLILR